MSDDAETQLPFYLQKPKLGDYFTGFLLAIVLTALPFFVVASGEGSRKSTMILIAACAIVQMAVQLRFFMHYLTKRVPIEATIALAMGILMGSVIIGGAIWVMYDLNYRMMG